MKTEIQIKKEIDRLNQMVLELSDKTYDEAIKHAKFEAETMIACLEWVLNK